MTDKARESWAHINELYPLELLEISEEVIGCLRQSSCQAFWSFTGPKPFWAEGKTPPNKKNNISAAFSYVVVSHAATIF
jgi:hypothetical protein